MARVWVLGSVAWDTVFRVPRLPPAGGVAPARPLGRRPGGSTANVARALGSAGHDVDLVAHVQEGPAGAELRAEVASWGVGTEHVTACEQCAAETVILLDDSGERTIFVVETACTVQVEVPRADVTAADCVFVGTFADYPAELPSLLRAGRGLVVTGLPPQDGDGEWFAHGVVGSEGDLPAGWRADPFRSVRERVAPGLRWLVVTQGEQGSTAYDASGAVCRVPAVPAERRDATGAGDAFAAGLLHGLLGGGDLASASALGSAWAAATLERVQSTPPPWVDLGLGPPDGALAGVEGSPSTAAR